MARYYPHRQTLIISVVSILAVIGVFLYVGRNDQNNTALLANSANEAQIDLTPPSENISETGDWRKSFIDDSTSAPVSKNGDIAPVKNQEPDTLTGDFGKNFFARYMLLQQNGQTEDSAAVKTIIDQSMDDLTVAAPTPKIYRQKDIIISMQTDIYSEKSYANAVGSIFYTDTPHEDATVIATEALTNSDESVLKEIDPIISSYQTMIQKLRSVSVPKNLTSYHLDIINGVSALLFMSEGMSKVMKDPMQGLVALSAYEGSQNAMHDALLHMDNYLNQKTITFEKSEPGAFFATIQ